VPVAQTLQFNGLPKSQFGLKLEINVALMKYPALSGF
jgi:hypothetical protein